MGEMYEYFQDFPEEDPGNYVDGQFNPEGARRLREQKAKLQKEQAALDAEIQAVIDKAKRNNQRKSQ